MFDPVDGPEEFAARRERVHEELVDAARSRDPERVREELRHHLDANMTTMLDRMSAVGGAGAWTTGEETA